LLVRDDGSGIERETLENGREGHWGVIGMRERADAIGAKFTIRSSRTAGTEVELSVPNSIAIRGQRGDFLPRMRKALFGANLEERRSKK
jgi:signal transduction histidine kinase